MRAVAPWWAAIGVATLVGQGALPLAVADEVRLRNGTLIHGEVVQEDDDVVVVRVTGGRIELPRGQVESIWIDGLPGGRPPVYLSPRRGTHGIEASEDPAPALVDPGLRREIIDLIGQAATGSADERPALLSRVVEAARAAPQVLVEELRASHLRTRTLVLVDALGLIGGLDAMDALRTRLEDPDPVVATAARSYLPLPALPTSSDPVTRAYLAAGADGRVRILAGLAREPDASLVWLLLRGLAAEDAATARQAEATLRTWLTARSPAKAAPASPARPAGERPPTPSGVPLMAFLGAAGRAPDAEAVRLCPVFARMDHPRLLEVLVAYLRRSDASVRAAAVRALGGSSGPEARARVMGALRDPDPAVRIEAVDALGRIRDPAAIPELIHTLLEPEPHLRAAATQVLQDLTGQNFPADAAAWADWYRRAGQ